VKRYANSNEVEVAAPKEVKMACVKNTNVNWLLRLVLCMLLRITVLASLLMFPPLSIGCVFETCLYLFFMLGCFYV
jgi:hypothetical protein